MVRIEGIDLDVNKKIVYALTGIYGIGLASSEKILASADIDPNTRTYNLTDEEIKKIREVLEQNYILEVNLRRSVKLNINRLVSINCFRGQRHRNSLPVRGQRTRTNSRTKRNLKN